jgi:Flp pilus assembly protein TadD
VGRYNEEPDAKAYHRASRAIVRKPSLGAVPCRFALLQAEHACRLAPENGAHRAALGAAQYRAGRHREAERTLRQAARLAEPVPADLAFLAMAQHRLGQADAAGATMIGLREMMRQAPWSADPEALALMREAGALMNAR